MPTKVFYFNGKEKHYSTGAAVSQSKFLSGHHLFFTATYNDFQGSIPTSPRSYKVQTSFRKVTLLLVKSLKIGSLSLAPAEPKQKTENLPSS